MLELKDSEKKCEFVSFCIENYKIKHRVQGKDAANLFKESGVLQFLIDGYDMLHTQGKEYILEEIEIFLKNRGYRI